MLFRLGARLNATTGSQAWDTETGPLTAAHLEVLGVLPQYLLFHGAPGY